MNKEAGSTLVISLIFLTVITLVAVYSLEGSNLQTKMVANSLFSAITYNECRNEQEANVSFYNSSFGSNRTVLLDAMRGGVDYSQTDTLTESDTRSSSTALPKSDLSITWSYQRDAPSFRGGYNIDSESQSKAHLFDHNCNATFRFANNNQTLGAVVEGLQQAGSVN